MLSMNSRPQSDRESFPAALSERERLLFETRKQVIEDILLYQIRNFYHRHEMSGKTVLDFGCGIGTSTVIMAKAYPDVHFVGVELDASLVEIGTRIQADERLSNVEFFSSPDGDHLPDEIAHSAFDMIMLSAVYEHLLPQERTKLIPQLWQRLKIGGRLFFNQTPHSWFPFEHHSTGLWFVNYLPDKLAHKVAMTWGKLNKSISNSPNWNIQLRGGIRGGSERMVLKNITDCGGSAKIVQPSIGSRDRAEYWLFQTSRKLYILKKVIALLFRVTDRTFGVVPSINMDLVVEKRS